MIADGKFAELLKDLYAAGVRQIELCSPGYQQFASLADGKQTKKIIEDNGLTCASSHFTFNEFRDGLPKAIAWAHDVGLTQIGTASLPANMGTQAQPIITMVNGVPSEDSIKRAADAYNQIAAATKKEGLQQFLHNEAFENSRTIDGRLTYPLLLQALDPDLVKMQFQMSSMQTIGNPITYFRLYPGRFISAHLHGVDLTTPPVARGAAMPVKPDPNAPPRGRGGGHAGAHGDRPRRRQRQLAGRVHRREGRRDEELLHRAGTGRRLGRDGEGDRVSEDAQRLSVPSVLTPGSRRPSDHRPRHAITPKPISIHVAGSGTGCTSTS